MSFSISEYGKIIGRRLFGAYILNLSVIIIILHIQLLLTRRSYKYLWSESIVGLCLILLINGIIISYFIIERIGHSNIVYNGPFSKYFVIPAVKRRLILLSRLIFGLCFGVVLHYYMVTRLASALQIEKYTDMISSSNSSKPFK